MRLIDADILIAELKESALHHCNNPREDSLLQRDRVIVRAQPTVEAIPKSEYDEMLKNGLLKDCEVCEAHLKDIYEARLKADMVAMLTEIQLEIEEMSGLCTEIHGDEWNEINTVHSQDVLSLIQQKINALKENTDDN